MVERPNKPSAIPVSPITPTAQVSITDNNDRVTATLPTGEYVEVLLHGATVLSWKSANGKENLFLSSKAILDGSKAVRGGIPVIFPVFGPPPTNHATSKLPQHGFARNSRWEYLGKSSSESESLKSGGDSSVKLDFGLSDRNEERATSKEWPYQFGLTYSVTLSTEGLRTNIVVNNSSKASWEFQVLLHTYLKVDSINDIAIHGLQDSTYRDKVTQKPSEPPTSKPIEIISEIDRVYKEVQTQPLLVLQKSAPRFEIVRDGLTDVVIWNPWKEKAVGMTDFGDDEWKSMVCVEAGFVSQWVGLDAGETWEGGQRIKAL